MSPHSHKIMTLFGISLALSPSWVLIALLVTWTLSAQVLPLRAPGAGEMAYVFYGLLGMLLFFASLVLHELAHALVARRFGRNVSQITLFIFGGVAELEDEFASAREEFFIASAGPIMSLMLTIGFWGSGAVATYLKSPAPLSEILYYLAIANLVLAVFNLLPAFPLDGGRILRSILWERSGDVMAATKVAAQSGVVLSYVLMGIGFALLFTGSVIAGAWQIFIGFFIFFAAKSHVAVQRTQTRLKSMTVGDLMTPDVISVEPDLTLSALVNQVLLPNRISFVPVMENEFLLGYIDTEVVSGIERENWSSTKVGDVFVETSTETVLRTNAPALDLLAKIGATGRRKFLVASSNRLRGVVTLADVSRYLSVLSELDRDPV